MIIFLYKDAHNYTHSSLIGEKGLGEIQCQSYDWLLNKKQIPKATYIFTDRERMDLWELRVYGGLFEHLKNAGSGYKVINDPAKMMNRRSLLRALYVEGINDFNAYSLTEKSSSIKFPVFLRREHDHAKPFTELLSNEQELEEALDKLRSDREPEDGVLITEYCAEAIEGTLFRKLSAYQMGDKTFFYNCVHERNWLVKYGTKNSATDALYEEEQSMILENTFKDVISRAFRIANIEYGRVDFGLVNGRAQIYEINTNPTTKPPSDHPNPIRVKNQLLAWEKYCKLLSALDTTDPTASFASKFTHAGLFMPKKPTVLNPLKYLQSWLCENSVKMRIRR